MTAKLNKKQRELLAREASHNATSALIASIVGIFILGIVFEPVALYYSIKARRTLKDLDNGDHASYTKATIALVISGILVGAFGVAFIIGFVSAL